MSYAQAAKSGPPQTAEERGCNLTPLRRAPPIPEIVHNDETVNLVDVDDPKVETVKADFLDQDVKTRTQAKRQELESDAKERADELKRKADAKKEQGKREAKKAGRSLQQNSDNPVFIGNAVTIAAFGGLLGYGVYSKYSAGQFTWKLAGIYAGAVGLFGVADYYVSSYFFQKYPPK